MFAFIWGGAAEKELALVDDEDKSIETHLA